jgi:membrane protein DedA with SNARE-associated domain
MLFASTDVEDLTGITGWVADVMSAMGAVGVALLTLLETFVPPIPSEVVLPMAGYLISEGELNWFGAILGATIGSLVGALAFYWLAAAIGRRRLDRWAAKIPLISEDDLGRAWAWFADHGRGAVLFGRLIPGVRSLISLPAGAARMDIWQFIVFTTLGSLVWNGALITAGWALGSQWQDLESYSNWFDLALVLIVVLIVARFMWTRRDRLKRTADTT